MAMHCVVCQVFESSRTNGSSCTTEMVTVASTADSSDEVSGAENDSDVENNSASVNCADVLR